MTQYPNGDTPPKAIMQTEKPVRDIRRMMADDDVLYEALVTPERTERFADALDALIKAKSVSGLRIYRDIAQKIGRRFEVDQEVIHRLGVPLTEAQQAVRAFQHVEGLDDAGTAEMVLGWLREFYRAKGMEVRLVRLATPEDPSALPEHELP